MTHTQPSLTFKRQFASPLFPKHHRIGKSSQRRRPIGAHPQAGYATSLCLEPTVRLFNTECSSVSCRRRAHTTPPPQMRPRATPKEAERGTAPDVAHNGLGFQCYAYPSGNTHKPWFTLRKLKQPWICLPLASARDREPVSNTGCTTSNFMQVQRLQVRSRSCSSLSSPYNSLSQAV